MNKETKVTLKCFFPNVLRRFYEYKEYENCGLCLTCIFLHCSIQESHSINLGDFFGKKQNTFFSIFFHKYKF